MSTSSFWKELAAKVDPTAYHPCRRPDVTVTRLESRHAEPYYVLKQPETRSYMRLSEADYALWWQMDGSHSLKDLLFYNLKRYRSLPIGRLNSLVADLRRGHFLQDVPTNLFAQVQQVLQARNPASRGRRLLDAFLHTEVSRGGLDPFFGLLYQLLGWLYTPLAQIGLLVLIVVGTVLFSRLFVLGTFSLSAQGGWSVVSLVLANLVVIGVHELAHGLTVKHARRELDRGGFLIYWGFPAFYVDTRDIWLSPRRQRIWVSWAGPHSGLLIGALVGVVLTAVTLPADGLMPFWMTFVYQLGFLAYFSVFINLNPLLELDGYFILMDWLEMPGLRQRALAFLRQELWPRTGQLLRHPGRRWQEYGRTERIFTLFGVLAAGYSVYALVFALYFWRDRLVPFIGTLWQREEWWGPALVLLLTALVIVPAVLLLMQYGWSRIRAGLEWLARRDLLARADVLALLLGAALFGGLLVVGLLLMRLPRFDLWLTLVVWVLHLSAVAALALVAWQLRGSRFQWALWALVAVPAALTLAWLAENPDWRLLWLTAAGLAFVAAGGVAWFTVQPAFLETADKVLMASFLLLGLVYGYGYTVVGNGRLWPDVWLLVGVFGGLMALSPLLVNFNHSRFSLPWLLLILGMLAVPWLRDAPLLHVPVIILWLYAALLYLLLGLLAQFQQQAAELSAVAVFDERERLVSAFNHFMSAMFTGYEAVFGGRRLLMIQAQMQALGAIDPDDSILDIAERCETALLLAVDRLDDLAGTPFTLAAGQAAYDSLPWLEAETLARHVLAESGWGDGLAHGFGQKRDRRADLIRQADIFAGFDEAGVAQTLAAAEMVSMRAGAELARSGEDADRFFLVDSGEVGVFHDGVQVAVIKPGGYFGMLALLDAGDYLATYRALTAVSLLVIPRNRFDPLLRADTTLASQVHTGIAERKLLKQMPLFASLSPQQLTAVAARMTTRDAAAGEVIVEQGQPRSHLFVIASGLVAVQMSVDGQGEAQAAGELGPGEHFGEYALFADTPYQATYVAQQETHLLLLDEPTFDRLVADYASMSHYVEQIGTGRLVATRRRLGVTAVIS